MSKLNCSDEITLLELLQIFWQQKKLILFITSIGFIVCAIYLYFTTPLYEASATILPASRSDISKLNTGRSYSPYSPIKAFKPLEVYDFFSEILLSNTIKQTFFKDVYLHFFTQNQKKIAIDQLYSSYSKNMRIKKDSSDKTMRYIITARSDNPATSEQLIQKYIALVQQQAAVKFQEYIKEQNEAYTENLQREINLIKKTLADHQEEHLNTIKSALALIKSAGIQNPILNINASNQLENKLRQLEYNYSFYKNLTIPLDSIKLFELDGSIMTPQAPVAPKIYLDLVLGLLTGLIIGSFVGLIKGLFLRKFQVVHQ